MKAVVQRVRSSSVTIDNHVHTEIGHGLLVLLGIHEDDSEKDIEWYVQKIIKMRIFNDEFGKMNCSVQDVCGEILIVSQFTLYGQADKGNRPSFIQAAKPDIAIPIYESFLKKLRVDFESTRVKSGVFGADMQVALVNDGPVTIIL